MKKILELEMAILKLKIRGWLLEVEKQFRLLLNAVITWLLRRKEWKE